jgi:hypothetical protein
MAERPPAAQDRRGALKALLALARETVAITRNERNAAILRRALRNKRRAA